jgi:lysophospholipase L1-like esterase
MRTVWTQGTDDWRLAHITGDEYREPDPVLLWKPMPRPPYNKQRFKGPVMAVPKPPGVFRIICYGDSNTDGPNKGGWPEQLQQLLDERPHRNGLRYEVANAGVAGYSSHQGLLRFQQEADQYRPDLIIVSFGWNDVAKTVGGHPDDDYHSAAWRVRILRVLLKSRLYLVLMRYLPTSRPPETGHQVSRVPLSSYLSNMATFAEAAGKHGAAVVFLTRPHREHEANLVRVPSWRAQVPVYNEGLRRWTKEQHLPLVDVQAIFESAGVEFFSDETHFTKAGHRHMAEMLVADLASKGLIPESRPAL